MSQSLAPFFSVVIPTFNRAEDLRRALESLERQSFRDFEVLVCDDGSSDHTEDVARSFADRLALTYLREENWGGPARPRNNGLRRARGEWVCFLDGDDWWYPEKLLRVRAHADRADVIYHDCRICAGDGRGKGYARGRSLKSPVFQDLLTGWNPLVTSATSVRKSVLLQSGGFREDRELIAVEDFDLWLTVARLTERFLYLPEPLGVYLVDGAGISHFSEKTAERERALFQRHAHLLDAETRRQATRMMLYRQGLIYWHVGDGAKSRELFRGAWLPLRWRHRLLIVPWMIATFFRGKKRNGDHPAC